MKSQKIKVSLTILFFSFIIVSSSCGFLPEKYKREIYALNTVVTLTAYGENGQKGLDEAAEEINRLEHMLSVTDPKSDIYKINNSAGKYTEVSDETAKLIKRAIEISELTQGAFDISIYPAVSLWGFTTGEYSVPTKIEIDSALKNVDYKKIQVEDRYVKIENGMSLDLGAIAKGYISDRVGEKIRENGVSSATVNLGGNVRTVGLHTDGSKWLIGIKNPSGNDNFAVIECSETAIVTSGAYQRNFTENGVLYHHIIDPHTGYPADSGISSMTVIYNDPTLCDALSTAFYVLGIEKTKTIANQLGVDYVILSSDKKIYTSENIKPYIKLSDGFTLS